MTTFWQDLLQEQNMLSKTYALQSNQYFVPLGDMGTLNIDGDDAEYFLQNLLTNDVSTLAINQTQRSGFCNAKGRLFAIFILIRRNNGYQIILPKNMASLLMQRLQMYILRSNVTISDVSEHSFCIGLIAQNNIQIEDPQPIGYPNDHNRSISICDQANIEKLISEYKQQGLDMMPQSCWQQLDIEQGLAMVWPETKELFTPQQVNLDLVNGVSFSKGCYPGQEIVARLHYLGKPSRRLFTAKAKASQLPEIAEEIIDEDGNISGHIVSAVEQEQDLELLLSLKLASSSASLFLKNGTPLKVQSLDVEE